MINKLKLDPDCISEEQVLCVLRLLGLNPSSYQFERSMAILGNPQATSCTWNQVGLAADLSPTNQHASCQPSLLKMCMLYSSLMFGLARSWLTAIARQCWKRLSRTRLSALYWNL